MRGPPSLPAASLTARAWPPMRPPSEGEGLAIGPATSSLSAAITRAIWASTSTAGVSSSSRRRMVSPMPTPSRAQSESSSAPLSKPCASVASAGTWGAPGTSTTLAERMLGPRERKSTSPWSTASSSSKTV